MMAPPENTLCQKTHDVVVHEPSNLDVFNTEPNYGEHMPCAHCHLHLKRDGIIKCPICGFDFSRWGLFRVILQASHDVGGCDTEMEGDAVNRFVMMPEEWCQPASASAIVPAAEDHHSCRDDTAEESYEACCGENDIHDDTLCQYADDATHHPIGTNHYTAFNPSTGEEYKVMSIEHTGSSWQVNLLSNGCGVTTGENGLVCEELQAVNQSLARLGQDRLKRLRNQLYKEEHKEKHKAVRETMGRVDAREDGRTAEAYAHEEGIEVHGEFFLVDDIEGYLHTEATASGYAHLSIANWAFTHCVNGGTGEAVYAVRACVPVKRSTGIEGSRCLMDAYTGVRALLLV